MVLSRKARNPEIHQKAYINIPSIPHFIASHRLGRKRSKGMAIDNRILGQQVPVCTPGPSMISKAAELGSNLPDVSSIFFRLLQQLFPTSCLGNDS
jgi:hypothetical protein